MVYQRITAILDGEDDWVTAMATVTCELHNAFDHYHWQYTVKQESSERLSLIEDEKKFIDILSKSPRLPPPRQRQPP